MWYNLKDDSNYSNVFVVHRNIGYQSLTFPIIIIIIRRGIIKTITAITALSLMSPINIGYQSSTFPYNVRTSLLCQFTVRMYLVFTLLLVFPFSLNVIVKKGTDIRLKCVVSCKSILLSIIITIINHYNC